MPIVINTYCSRDPIGSHMWKKVRFYDIAYNMEACPGYHLELLCGSDTKDKKSGYILKLLNMRQLLSLLRRQAINLVAGLTCCNKPIQINHFSAVNTYQYLRIFQ